MKKISLILFLFTSINCSAQWTDNFSDGDFNNNPTWNGDTLQWEVLNGMLHSNDTIVNDNFYLSTQSTIAATAQWEFWDSLQFNTSSANYIDVYLISDNANLKAASFNGFFVRIGNTLDEICLYKRTGSTTTKIIDGVDNILNTSSSKARIKVTRDAANLWTLQRDLSGTGNNYFTEGTVTDAAFQASSYFGVAVKQSTASFFKKHFFDDFSAGPFIVDTIAPTINQLIVISQNALDIKFSENVEQTSAETIINYSVDNSIGNPLTATRDLSDPTLVHLNFSTPFTLGTPYTITVSNVKDVSNNTINATSLGFVYYVPSFLDVVVNEIMADSDPVVGLPDFEYLELFNRTPFPINLKNWTITIGSTTKIFPDINILPDSFLILTYTSAVSLFQAYGPTIGLFTLTTTITNTGAAIVLKNISDQIISTVTYSDSWYRDTQKQNGGWSLEQISPLMSCAGQENWNASNNISGGTPGRRNSVYQNLPDNTAPRLIRAGVIDSMHVQIYFSEPMDSATLLSTTTYLVNNGIGNPQSVSLISPNYSSVILTLSQPVPQDVIYTDHIHQRLRRQYYSCQFNYQVRYSKNHSAKRHHHQRSPIRFQNRGSQLH
ncbi:MAG: lamin tail domain-containing protein [Bacteroidia bacterium]|nr:lamin tail domain-containing protein [Bacteroidia bacterium]